MSKHNPYLNPTSYAVFKSVLPKLDGKQSVMIDRASMSGQKLRTVYQKITAGWQYAILLAEQQGNTEELTRLKELRETYVVRCYADKAIVFQVKVKALNVEEVPSTLDDDLFNKYIENITKFLSDPAAFNNCLLVEKVIVTSEVKRRLNELFPRLRASGFECKANRNGFFVSFGSLSVPKVFEEDDLVEVVVSNKEEKK